MEMTMRRPINIIMKMRMTRIKKSKDKNKIVISEKAM
jgi:hypothetical protein